MSTPTPLQLGNRGTNTNPAIEIGNHVPHSGFGQFPQWTHIFSDDTILVAGVSGQVVAFGSQPASGAATSALFTMDVSGNIGVQGILSLGGTHAGQISAASGVPVANSALPPGSFYLRTDATDGGPRLYQWQPQSEGANGGAWLEIPAGLGLYNVKDFGAVGDGVADDSGAINNALTAATSMDAFGTTGGCVYFPAGDYNIGSPLSVISNGGQLMLCGAGSSSVISSYSDIDLLQISNGTNGLTIRDLNFNYAGVRHAVSGAAMRFNGGGGQFLIENVNTTNVAVGLFAANSGGSGQIISSSLKANVAGAYITAGAEIHHTHLNGGTYGLVIDGANGCKMTNVALFGVLSFTSWFTDKGGQSQNSTYGYDVEANYGDVVNTSKPADATTTSGIALTYPSASYVVGVTSTSPFLSGASAYIRDLSDTLALRGTITSISSGAGTLSLTSTFQSSASGTFPSGSRVWNDPPPYPVELAGEGAGSTSLQSAAAQVHLTDCWFQGSTAIGGTPPRITTTTSPLTVASTPSGYVVSVASSADFLYDDGIFVSGSTDWIRGTITSVTSPTAIAFSSTSVSGAGTIASGAVVTSPFTFGGVYLTPVPPQKAGYPFVPGDVTILGGNWSGGKDKYPPGVPNLSQDAIEVFEGTLVTIAGANISLGAPATGSGIHIHGDVVAASITGNNIAPSNTPPHSISIESSQGISCQSNLVTASPSAITWPASTTQPFSISSNPGFNPTGFFTPPLSGLVPDPMTLINTYGVPGTFYVGGGSVSKIEVYDALSATFNDTGVQGGGFHAEPGAQVRVTWSSLPSMVFVGD